ncbi:MAG: hypothetical protein NTZ97_03220 [Candidatus Moranbacteria bacterium]|nr:hypothetical protein [Candidatus Moranbacteria bacterium]
MASKTKTHMSRMRMEVNILPLENIEKKIHISRIAHGSPWKLFAHLIHLAFFLVAKECHAAALTWKQDTQDFLDAIHNFRRRYEFSTEKIAIFFLIYVIAIFWMRSNTLIFTALSNQEIPVPYSFVTDGEEKISASKIDLNALKPSNGFKMYLTKEECEKDKQEEECSVECGEINAYKDVKVPGGEIQKVPVKKYIQVKISCRESNYGHPGKSATKGKHMDEDCCPDPDEWPKPGCVYDAHSYAIMLSGPGKKK